MWDPILQSPGLFLALNSPGFTLTEYGRPIRGAPSDTCVAFRLDEIVDSDELTFGALRRARGGSLCIRANNSGAALPLRLLAAACVVFLFFFFLGQYCVHKQLPPHFCTVGVPPCWEIPISGNGRLEFRWSGHKPTLVRGGTLNCSAAATKERGLPKRDSSTNTVCVDSLLNSEWGTGRGDHWPSKVPQ